jgi:hypothetical protein
MTTPAIRSQRVPARVLKSPLAVPGHSAHPDVTAAVSALASTRQAQLSEREATLAEFEGYLQTVNNRDGRPYEEKTISVYSVPARNLDGWMTASTARTLPRQAWMHGHRGSPKLAPRRRRWLQEGTGRHGAPCARRASADPMPNSAS